MSEAASQSKHQVILFFGVVGAGKGTQVELLREFLHKQGEDTLYMYVGAELRRHIESGSYVGTCIKDSMERGELQPSFLADTLMVDLVMENYTGTQHLFFDGYPRKLKQSETLEAMRQFFKWGQPTIIFIELSNEEAITRLTKRGRSDDTPAGIEQRIKEYKQNVLPSLEHLQSLGEYNFHAINGEQSIEAVHNDILQALGLDS